ncbi:hypothetical protein SAY87_019083 [Trapa incisa]|uniref:Pentatricopeptide repeat-containing protein n=1 Tax=Trapa incisa TaxID=236973 RepID=A0AAN7K1W7_9MYRT|nr:hypothetical protein SAY87_019083 [Trapa incisa]
MRPLQSLMQSSASALSKVLSTHCLSIKLGTISDVYAVNNLINGYARSRELSIACKLFDEMPHRDTISWNTLIAGFVHCGEFECAMEVLRSMRRGGMSIDVYTFGSILKGVAGVHRPALGEQLHSVILKVGLLDNVYCGSALLDMYAKSHRVWDAFVILQHMHRPNSISWNALISGFSQNKDREMAFFLLLCMGREGVKPDDGTFAPLLTLLDGPKFYRHAMQIHAKAIKSGLDSRNTVCNATITSYSECGSIEDAKRVFNDSCLMQDIVTWNSMIAAYLAHSEEGSAFKLFVHMQHVGFEPDIYTYTSIISACFEESPKNMGICLHCLVIKKGLEISVPISNALIAMYLKSDNRSMEEALRIFEAIESKDRVSWNSILTGYSQIGLSENSLKLFAHMRYLLVEIDHYSFSAVLKSCSDLATLQLGQEVHTLTIKTGFESNEFVAGSLIFMYSKCGIIEDARNSFEETQQDSSVTWNSIIFGYAQHGLGHDALDLFRLMTERRVKPDHITFVAVLTACSHIGLVEEGEKIMDSMEQDYGIPLRMEHYACLIDLFGRSGCINKAKALVESMPFRPDPMVWKTLLGACRTCGDIELARTVASQLLELEPEEHCTYILLSDMYGNLGKWGHKAEIKRLMRERGVRKVPGWSWIEVQNEVHSFNADDHSHPNCKEIYCVLIGLMEEIKLLNLDLDAHLEVSEGSFHREMLTDDVQFE